MLITGKNMRTIIVILSLAAFVLSLISFIISIKAIREKKDGEETGEKRGKKDA